MERNSDMTQWSIHENTGLTYKMHDNALYVVYWIMDDNAGSWCVGIDSFYFLYEQILSFQFFQISDDRIMYHGYLSGHTDKGGLHWCGGN